MADPVFPATLPACRVGDGYGYKPEDAFSRTNMDSGYARQRRRFTSTPTAVTGKWRLTTAQLGYFERFWKRDIMDGAAWFVVRLTNGRGTNAVRARFTEAYQVTGTDSPDVFDVAGKLETFSLPVAP